MKAYCGRKFERKSRTNFSRKFGKTRAKILPTPKNLPAPTPVVVGSIGITDRGARGRDALPGNLFLHFSGCLRFFYLWTSTTSWDSLSFLNLFL